ncbi:MAG: hypothetical protein O2973_08490 [Gemmatimonadetes bacterium]|nr:hypothetical protein [Gemmatimonadota bacterium]
MPSFIRHISSPRRALASCLVAIPIVLSLSCAGGPPPSPIAIAALPREIRVQEWPYWIDIPMQEKNVDRIWRVVIDVIGERAAVAVMDRESGYMRTEYKPSNTMYGRAPTDRTLARTVVAAGEGAVEERYTVRIRPLESKIRLGVEVRFRGTNEYAAWLVNTNNSPWTAVYRELQ